MIVVTNRVVAEAEARSCRVSVVVVSALLVVVIVAVIVLVVRHNRGFVSMKIMGLSDKQHATDVFYYKCQ